MCKPTCACVGFHQLSKTKLGLSYVSTKTPPLVHPHKGLSILYHSTNKESQHNHNTSIGLGERKSSLRCRGFSLRVHAPQGKPTQSQHVNRSFLTHLGPCPFLILDSASNAVALPRSPPGVDRPRRCPSPLPKGLIPDVPLKHRDLGCRQVKARRLAAVAEGSSTSIARTEVVVEAPRLWHQVRHPPMAKFDCASCVREFPRCVREFPACVPSICKGCNKHM